MNPDLAAKYAAKYGGKKTSLTPQFSQNAVKSRAIPTATQLTPKKNSGGAIPQFLDYSKRVAGQTLNIGKSIGIAGGKFVGNTVVDIGKSALLAAKTLVDIRTQPMVNRLTEEANRGLDIKKGEAAQAYKSGRMSRDDYIKTLDDVTKQAMVLSKESQKVSQGPSPLERGFAVAETAVNILSLGSLGIAASSAKSGLTQGGKQLSKSAVKSLVDDGATSVERAFLKVPATRALIERNIMAASKREAQKLAGETSYQFVKREGRKIAADLLIKRPLYYQQNIGDANKIFDSVLSGDYPTALKTGAWMSTQLLNGGPIGVFFKGKDYLKGSLKKLAYGNESVIDGISRRIGDGDSTQIARYVQDQLSAGNKEPEKIFRILQETNLRVSGEKVSDAVDNILRNYEYSNVPLSEITPERIFKDYDNWRKADEVLDVIKKKGLKGIKEGDIENLVVVRWDSIMKRGLASAIEQGTDKNSMREILKEMSERPGNAWGENNILVGQLNRIINESETAEDAAKAIRSIPTATATPKNIPSNLAKQLSDLGYSIAVPAGGRATPKVDYDDTRKLVTRAIDGTGVFDEATSPQPELAAIAGALERVGLSPQAANREAFRKLSESVATSLENTTAGREIGFKNTGSIATGGKALLSKLQQYVENKRPAFGLGQRAAVTDLRQLTLKEISEALSSKSFKVDKDMAKEVRKAVMQGYLDVPLETRGLGDWVQDRLFSLNPAQKYYSRVQSALRYTYNPFFRIQETSETSILSGLSGGNKFPHIFWNKDRQELNATVKTLEDTGLFGGKFASSLAGEAAQDNVLGRLSANLTKGQKQDLAGLAMDMAKNRGTDVASMIKNNPDELADALRVIVQYPQKGILASSLARTMNLAFFPMRYNLKVTALAAEVLAKQPPTIQKAVLHSLFNMKDWLNSDEGIVWRSKHADAISVFSWITPINSVDYAYKLLSEEGEGWADLGQLGGLPIGVITQILDSQGIISLNRPYVDPRTGDVIPKYVPQSAKARAAVALGDLLGSMFTYPGRTLGLPGKGQAIRGFVKNFIATEGEEFDKRVETERLTPLQKRYIEVLKGNTSDEAINALYNAPAVGQFNWYTIPPLNLPMSEQTRVVAPTPKETGLTKRTGLPSGKKARRGKKPKPVAKPIAQPI